MSSDLQFTIPAVRRELKWRGLLSLSVVVSSISPLFAAVLVDPTVTLSAPELADDEVSLALTGEPGVAYVIEASTNTQSWLPVLTNNDSAILRTITVPALGDRSFYRAARDPLPVFDAAIAAVGTIDFDGKNVFSDSFDSGDPNYSVQALYPFASPDKQRDHGDLVAGTVITNSVNVGNTLVKGHVRTGAGGTVYVGPSGSIGSKSWVEGGTNGIQPGFFTDDMNIHFPSVKLPTTTWFPASSVNIQIGGVYYDRVFLTSGDYPFPSFTKGIYVGTNAVVRLWITGDINATAVTNVIRIADGARLTIYMSGSTFRLGGNGVVNEAGIASRFYYFGLPGNQSLHFVRNGDFTGAICAPDTDFYPGGGGSLTYDFIGACVAKSVTMNGHFYFHFDEDLRRTGPTR